MSDRVVSLFVRYGTCTFRRPEYRTANPIRRISWKNEGKKEKFPGMEDFFPLLLFEFEFEFKTKFGLGFQIPLHVTDWTVLGST